MKVSLDFAPGLHGHFLELVVNKYIYGCNAPTGPIFQKSGAAHGINFDSAYKANKIVFARHHSSFNAPYPADATSVVFIEHNPKLDFVLLTNIYYRCHPDAVSTRDVNASEIIEMHNKFLLEDTDWQRKNNWFSKLSERQFEHASMKPVTSLPVYFFDYSSFFNLSDFCRELKNLSKFLNETFKFDSSLSVLWEEFIQKNQGWNLYMLGNQLLDATLAGKDAAIPDDWKLHAFLNFKISTMFDLYDGRLYNSERYPETTCELLDVIANHIINFDSRW